MFCYRHEVVNVNLREKPDWFLQRNPEGKVPVIEHDDKVYIFLLIFLNVLVWIYVVLQNYAYYLDFITLNKHWSYHSLSLQLCHIILSKIYLCVFLLDFVGIGHLQRLSGWSLSRWKAKSNRSIWESETENSTGEMGKGISELNSDYYTLEIIEWDPTCNIETENIDITIWTSELSYSQHRL